MLLPTDFIEFLKIGLMVQQIKDYFGGIFFKAKQKIPNTNKYEMCAEALADIVVFNQTFLQAKKCKKKKNLNYAVCVSRLSADYCSFLSNFFACKKYKNKKNLNYAVCVSRLSIDTVVIYQTFSRAKNAKKEEPQLRGLRVEALG